MTDHTPLVSIITINYNSKAETLDFIQSLQQSTYKNWELIVVDNHSRESPKEEVMALCPEAQVILSPENLGFAGGNNLALDVCRGEYLFFVNNDTLLPTDCLEILVNTAQDLPDLGALSPKFHYFHSPGIIEYAGCTNINMLTARNQALHNRERDEGVSGLIETFYMHGGGMLVPKKVVDDIGPMANTFFLYYEEMDWSERMRKAGYKIYCQRDTVIYHKESASVGRMSPLKTYYMNRNRILFMKRNYGFLQLLPFTLFFIFVSFPKNFLGFLLKGQWAHLRAFCRGVFYHFNSKLTF